MAIFPFCFNAENTISSVQSYKLAVGQLFPVRLNPFKAVKLSLEKEIARQEKMLDKLSLEKAFRIN